MAQPTNYYVDPAGGDDTTGDGSVGTPWKTVQKALNTITRDATNGDQINVKAGTADVLSAGLTLATYGAPSSGAPLFFRGYTATANDGGIGEISGGGAVSILIAATTDNVGFADMKIGNCGGNIVIQLRNAAWFWNCEIHTNTTHGIALGSWVMLVGCYVHDLGGSYHLNAAGGLVFGCYFKKGSGSSPVAIQNGLTVEATVIDGFETGIVVPQGGIVTGCTIRGNTAANAEGILAAFYSSIINCHVEGYTGAGAAGIRWPSGAAMSRNNSFYNNTANEVVGDYLLEQGGSQALGASPLTNPAGGDYSVSEAIKALGLPSAIRGSATTSYVDIGAAQRPEGAGGVFRRPARVHGG